MTEEGLLEAIVTSGYPLQTVVAAALTDRGFRVSEEWAYQDPDTHARRSMDVVAEWPASSAPHRTKAGASTLTLSLIVECKQTRNPYVFFEAVDPPDFERFPLVTGLGNGLVRLAPEGNWAELPHMNFHKAPFYREISVQKFLGATDHRFVNQPPLVSSISKATPRGKRVELSGDEPYNSLLMPLTKAAQVYRDDLPNYRSAGQQHDIHAVVPVAVIDAPMVLVGKLEDEPDPAIASWVRVIVRRVHGNRPWWDPLDHDVVDIVHRGFFQHYLDEYALPYAVDFWHRHTAHHNESVGGQTFVTELPERGALPEDLLERLVPTGRYA